MTPPRFLGGAIERALRVCVDLFASDVHVACGAVPWIRQGGRFAPDESLGFVAADEVRVCAEGLGGEDSSVAVEAAGSRWRATVYGALDGTRLAFRRVASDPPVLGMLGLPESVRGLAGLRDGLIIAAGATGSGKSSTLAALIDLINETRACHIMTLEDPIEYVHRPKRAMISQRQVPSDATAQALLTAMRADPDVVLVGECRSRAQFETAMEMAATGHLVLTTLHARDCVSTCERIAAATGVQGEQMLSQTLRAVIAQRLIPDIEDERKRHCAAEIMIMDNFYANKIKPGGNTSEIRQQLSNESCSLDIVLAEMVREQKISHAAALREATDQAAFKERAGHSVRPGNAAIPSPAGAMPQPSLRSGGARKRRLRRSRI